MNKRKLQIIIGCVVLFAVSAFLVIQIRSGLIDLEALQQYLEALDPVWFFGAMVILPAFGVPVSPFLVAAGAIYSLEVAIFGCVTALSLNMTLSWFVSGYCLRPFCERLLARFGQQVPRLTRANSIRIAILLRLTPGFPFVLQNYLLGVARMPLLWYLLVSIPIAGMIDVGIILFGDALLEGNVAMIGGAVFLILLMTFLIRSVRERMKGSVTNFEVG